MSHLASVIVINHNGGDAVVECVQSIIGQDISRSEREVIVVDNASTDGSLQAIARHRGIHFIGRDRNTGFAPAANAGVERAGGEYVAFVNSDARLARDWLTRMIDGISETGAECVTSRIDSWDGEETEYEGGVVSFLGHCWEASPGGRRKRPWLLFPHGAAMLVRRDVFVDVGGFDPSYFAYFEDVDFGWRLNLFGYRVGIVPEAVAYHLGQGTAGKISYAQRLLLYERNALMTIYKNYEDENLEKVLPAAIQLTLARALARANLTPEQYALNGGDGAGPEEMPRLATATFMAVDDFIDRLDGLRERRKAIQEQRKRTDREILPLFGDPFHAHEMGPAYERALRGAVEMFGIREIFES